MNEETNIDDFEAELQKLQDELVAQRAAEAEPKDEKPADAAPVEPVKTEEPEKFQMSDDDLVDPALSVLDRLGEDKRREHLQKRWGYDLTPRKEIATAMEDTARGAEKKAFADVVQDLYEKSDKANLPSDFDQLDGGTQYAILQASAVDSLASRKAQEAVAPLLSAEEKRAYEGWKGEQSNAIATSLGAPGAAPDVKSFIDRLTPDEVGLYFQQKEAGGGEFVNMRDARVKGIVESFASSQLPPETELPKAEPVGGKETYNEKGMNDRQKEFYDKIANDPDFAGTDVAERFKQRI